MKVGERGFKDAAVLGISKKSRKKAVSAMAVTAKKVGGCGCMQR